MPTLTIPQQKQYLPYFPLSWDLATRPPLHGPAGKEFARSVEEILTYWNESCEQIRVLREAHKTIGYQPIPPKRTFMVPIQYYVRGRGEPLSYRIDDE